MAVPVMARSASWMGSGAMPVVILVGSTFDDQTAPVATEAYNVPLAFQSFHGKPLIEHWWDTLATAGLNLTTHIFVATNASNYKSFEFWALGKGIPISHIVNSGASTALGDARVGLRTVVLAMRASDKTVAHGTSADAAGGFPHDFLVIGVDSAPPHTGAAFSSVIETLAVAESTTILLQPATAGDAAAAAADGPAVRSYYVTDPATGVNVVKDVALSTAAPAAAAPAAAELAGVASAFTPLCTLVKGADAHALTAEAASAAAGADTGNAIVPIEAGLSYLARSRTVLGVALTCPYQVGAANGTAHALPGGATTATAGAGASPAGGSSAGAAATGGAVALSVPSPFFSHAPIRTRAYARVGVLGNPSDGFCGKTMSVTIANFFAEVLLHPSSSSAISLVPHHIYDPSTFDNLRQLSTISGREGYSGGLRLLQAALHRFFRHCRVREIDLHDRGFTARYHTTIPRQVGLAGSSAIITAFIRAVLVHYGFDTEERAAAIGLSRDELPSFVLAIESEELGITAGLQDRVVQSYEGLVHMDFNADQVKARGYGTYTKLPASALPPLFLAYAADPSDSGRIHAPVKQRWLAGDKEVIDGMTHIASLADAGKVLASTTPYSSAPSATTKEPIVAEWAKLFFDNFESRRKLFSDAALGRDNLRMIQIARDMGTSAKFPGSGGAILGVVDVAGIEAAGKLPAGVTAASAAAGAVAGSDSERLNAAIGVLREAYLAEGYVFTMLRPHESGSA